MARDGQRATGRTRKNFSLQEAADWYGVSARTIRRRISEGKLPAYRVGGVIRISIEDLEALARRIPSASTRIRKDLY